MSGQEKPDEAVDWSRVIEKNLREQLATAKSYAATLSVELDVERQVHDEEEARLRAQIGVVEAERARECALALAAHLSAVPVEGEAEWGFESLQPGLWYVTRNQMLAETMKAGRPEAVLYGRKAGPWVEVSS